MSYDAPPPPQSPPPPPMGGPGYGAQVPAANNQKALWSMILGILSLLQCCSLVTGIVAIVLGSMAKKEIAANGQGGEGMAKAGVILGIIGLVIWAILLVLSLSGAITVPGMPTGTTTS